MILTLYIMVLFLFVLFLLYESESIPGVDERYGGLGQECG